MRRPPGTSPHVRRRSGACSPIPRAAPSSLSGGRATRSRQTSGRGSVSETRPAGSQGATDEPSGATSTTSLRGTRVGPQIIAISSTSAATIIASSTRPLGRCRRVPLLSPRTCSRAPVPSPGRLRQVGPTSTTRRCRDRLDLHPGRGRRKDHDLRQSRRTAVPDLSQNRARRHLGPASRTSRRSDRDPVSPEVVGALLTGSGSVSWTAASGAQQVQRRARKLCPELSRLGERPLGREWIRGEPVRRRDDSGPDRSRWVGSACPDRSAGSSACADRRG